MKAYVFDMDGTLVDNCGYHVAAWQAFARRHGKELTREQVLGWMGQTNRAYLERLFGRPVGEEEAARLGEEKEKLYRELYAPRLRPRDGLRELLARARAAGVPCAVATGAPRGNLDFVLDGTGLRDAFAALVDDSMYARGKPEPDCFLAAAERLGAAPKECVVFEDAVSGVVAARRAGMRVIAVGDTGAPAALRAAGAERVVSGFGEIAGLP